MPTLITGAGGYLGRLLLLELSRRGEEVHAFAHTSKREEVEFNKNITVYWGDVQDAEGLHDAIEGCHRVYHLAALASNWASDPDLFRRVNVEGTRNLLRSCKEHGIEKVVHTSTAGVIGPQHQPEHFVTEKDGADYSPLTLYEQTKSEAEELVREYAENGGNAVIVNPTRIFGPGHLSTSNAVTKMIQGYLEGKWRIIPGNGKSMGNYAYASDVVEGHIRAMEKGKAGERYLLGGENLDFDHFFDTLARVSGIRRRMIHLPHWSMMAIAHLMKTYSQLTHTAPLITPLWVQKYDQHWGTDCSKAQEELGYEITPFAQAVEETVEWIRENASELGR